MPNIEGNCSRCKDYGKLDIILLLWGNQYEFCCMDCLYKFIRDEGEF
jgi:hypothetical protein